MSLKKIYPLFLFLQIAFTTTLFIPKTEFWGVQRYLPLKFQGRKSTGQKNSILYATFEGRSFQRKNPVFLFFFFFFFFFFFLPKKSTQDLSLLIADMDMLNFGESWSIKWRVGDGLNNPANNILQGFIIFSDFRSTAQAGWSREGCLRKTGQR